MKPAKKIAKKHRRIKEWRQTNFDMKPDQRWQTGGYKCPGSNK